MGNKSEGKLEVLGCKRLKNRKMIILDKAYV